MSASKNLLEHVPQALRQPLDGYEHIIPQLVPQFLDGADFEQALGYVQGALAHQERVHDDASKVFKGVIERVEVIERTSGSGFVLGKKAVIHFISTGQGGREESQDINTGWIEYNGYDPHLAAFEIALSKTIVSIAEENVGVECLIRKAFVEAETSSGGNRVRYAADLFPINTSGNSKGSSKKESGRKSRDDDRGRSRRSRGGVSQEQLEELADDLNLQNVRGRDIKALAEILTEFQDVEDVIEEITAEFELRRKDVAEFIEGRDLPTEALKALDELL